MRKKEDWTIMARNYSSERSMHKIFAPRWFFEVRDRCVPRGMDPEQCMAKPFLLNDLMLSIRKRTLDIQTGQN